MILPSLLCMGTLLAVFLVAVVTCAYLQVPIFQLHKLSISSPHQRRVLNSGRVRGAQKEGILIYQSLRVTFLGSMAHLLQRLTLMFPPKVLLSRGTKYIALI